MTKQSFKLKNISCPVCAADLSLDIENLKGVTSADASFHRSSLTVVYDENTITKEEITSFLTQKGF